MRVESLRRDYLRQRESLSAEEVARRSGAVLSTLIESDLLTSGMHVGLYHPFRGEVDVLPLISFRKDVTYYLPRCRDVFLEYCPWQLGDPLADPLVAGRWRIPEPAPQVSSVSLNSLDLIVVPGVVFDFRGHRLGFGQGCYDRMLTSFNGVAVGVAYDFQVVAEIAVQPHDQSCDWVVSEQAVLRGTPRRL